MELLKMLSVSEIVAQIISFLILFFLLRAFLWKPILKALDSRREKIASDLKKMEEGRVAIEKIRLEYEDKIKSIEAATAAKIQQALMEGQRAAEDIRQDARKESEKIVKDAKADMMREVAKAKEELKNEIASLALGATEKLLQEKVTEEKDKQLVNDFLRQLDNIK